MATYAKAPIHSAFSSAFRVTSGSPLRRFDDLGRLVPEGRGEFQMAALHLRMGDVTLRLARPMRRNLGSRRALMIAFREVRLDLLASGARRFEVRVAVAPNFRLAARPTVDVVAEGGQATRQFRPVERGRIRLRPIELARLE